MRTPHLLLAASIAAILSGCASREEIQELEAAKAVVAQVEASPHASRAAANVNEARNAFDRAIDASEDGEDFHTVKHHAYVATRHAQIANEKIISVEAAQKLKQAEAERQQVIVQARERETLAARNRAESAQSRAQTAEERAKALEEEARRLAMEREELQRELQTIKDLNAKQIDRGLVLTLGDVLFDVDQATLKPGAMNTMDRLANFLKQQEDRSVIVEGHTDSTGADEYNMDLSRRRAEAVRSALVSRGVSSQQIEALGKGEAVPVASNDNVGGRQQNRRVEIIIPNDPGQPAVAGTDEQ